MDRPRPGCRGGRDNFKWDDVKEDKDRTNYLGNSLKAPVGRWQNNRDLEWYTRPVDSLGSSSSRTTKSSFVPGKRSSKSSSISKNNSIPSRDAINRKKELDDVKAKEREMMKRALAFGIGASVDDAVNNSVSQSELKRVIASDEMEPVAAVEDVGGLGYYARKGKKSSSSKPY